MNKLIILIALFLNACASDFINYDIKQNGQIKEILVKNENNKYITSQNLAFEDNSKIVIKFNIVTPELINEFEAKYDLTLSQILISGGYIYIHKDNNVLDLIHQITNESNVNSIEPLWRKKVKLY